MSFGARQRPVTEWFPGVVVSTIGLLLLGAPLLDLWDDVTHSNWSLWPALAESVAWVALAGVLIAGGFWIHRQDWEKAHSLMVTKWTLLGLFVAGIAFGWDFLIRELTAKDPKPFIIALDGILLGTVGMFAAGIYYAQSDVRTEQLRTERERFSSLFQNTADAIAAVEFTSRDQTVVEVNSSFEETFGVETSSVLTDVFDNLRADYDREDLIERGRQEEITDLELHRVTVDGPRDFYVRIVPYEAGQTEVRAYVVFTDITDQKRLARERHVNEHMRTLHDVATRLAEADTREEAFELSMDAAERVVDAAAARITIDGEKVIERTILGAGTGALEAQTVVGSVGDRGHLEVMGEAFRDYERSSIELLGRYLDRVIARIDREHQLEAELDETLERVSNAVVALDDNWQFTYVNDRARELVVEGEGDPIGETVWELDPPLVGSAFEDRYRRAMETQEVVSFVEYVPSLTSWYEVHAYPSETGLSIYFQDVTERKNRERELRRQREELAAFNQLHDTIQEITQAIIQQSTREETEQRVCERLADADPYAFASILDVDRLTDDIVVRAADGDESALGEAEPFEFPPSEQSPARQAFQSQEIHVRKDAEEDGVAPSMDASRDQVDGGSMAAIPITHGEKRYGILTVYTERGTAFGERERELIGRLGDVLGHAINAIERKRALVAEKVIAVEFQVPDSVQSLAGVEDPTGTITFERMVPVGGESFLIYGTATPDAVADVEAFAEGYGPAEHLKLFDEPDEIDDQRRFELRVSRLPVASYVAEQGGRVRDAQFDAGDLRMVIEVPEGTDIGALIDRIQDDYPAAEHIAQQHTEREDTPLDPPEAAFAEELSDRQREALEVAYHSGYFDWPRNASGDDLADSMGISPPTFHQHFRTAQQKIFDSLFNRTQQAVGI